MASTKYDVVAFPAGRHCIVPEAKTKNLQKAETIISLLGISTTLTLGFLIRYYRFRADLTKNGLADEAGLSRHTIREIEEDAPSYEPDNATLLALANYFNGRYGQVFEEALNHIGYTIKRTP